MTIKPAGQQVCEEVYAQIAERSHLKHLFHQTWRAGDTPDGVHKEYVVGAEAAVTA